MDNSNYWPYTNIHELNLDWIISKIKELDTRFTDDIETFVREYIDEHFAEWTVNANYHADDETIIYTNGTGATLTAGDVIRFAIDNVYVNVKDPTARTAASNAATAAAAAQGTADNIINGTVAIPYISNNGGSINGDLTVSGSLSGSLNASNIVTNVITGSDVFETTHTINNAYMIKIGKLTTISITLTTTAAVSAFANIGRFKNVILNSSEYFVAYLGGTASTEMYIGTDGTMSPAQSLNSGQQIKLTATLVTA